MRKITALLLLVFIVALGSCNNDDLDEIRRDQAELADRVSSLEAWQKEINENISGLQSMIKALEDKDYVTDVTELADGSGYVINFVKSGAVTIKHGASPIISVKADNGVYYWTLNGEWLMDTSGNKLRVSGERGDAGADAIAPQIRINSQTNEWEISTDGGTSWESKGVKATGDKGDAFFAKKPEITSDYVIFTLADGDNDDTNNPTFTIPVYKPFSIGTKSENGFCEIGYRTVTKLPLILPDSFQEEDYTAIVARFIKEVDGTTIVPRTAADDWEVDVTKPSFDENGKYRKDAAVTVTPPAKITGNTILEVTLIGNDGNRQVATRVLKEGRNSVGDFYMKDGTLVSGDITLTDQQQANCIGIVFWVGDPTKADHTTAETGYNSDKGTTLSEFGDPALREEHSDCTHGLVVAALQGERKKWQKTASNIAEWQQNKATALAAKSYLVTVASTNASDDNCNKLRGYNNTVVMRAYNAYCKNTSGMGDNLILPIEAIDDYNKKFAAPGSSSGWYFPSFKELTLWGGKDVNDIVMNCLFLGNAGFINDKLGSISGASQISSWYWSSTEATPYNESVFTLQIDNGYVSSGGTMKDGAIGGVRYILAF